MIAMFGATTLTADWGEQLINSVATQAIAHLFSASEAVTVRVGCFPATKILQGQVDSFQMQGQGLVIRRQFPVAAMTFSTDAVAIDLGALLQGKLRLQHPTQAIAEITLTEAGINQAFTSDLVQKRLQNILTPELAAISGEEPVSFTNIRVNVLPHNHVKIYADVELPFHGLVPVRVMTTLAIERRTRICFTQAQWLAEDVAPEKELISQRLTAAFVALLNDMVDLDRFDLDGIVLKLNRLLTQGDELILSGYAEIRHFPRVGEPTPAWYPVAA